MPKKAEKKKKAWQRSCRAQVKAGLYNDAGGNWVSQSKLQNDRMAEMMKAGYRL